MTTVAPSVTCRAAVTSDEKSTCPGQWIKFTRKPVILRDIGLIITGGTLEGSTLLFCGLTLGDGIKVAHLMLGHFIEQGEGPLNVQYNKYMQSLICK